MTPVSSTAHTLASSFPRRMELLEVRLERVLRDMRAFHSDFLRAERDKGVLGSRGLTEYVMEVLELNSQATRSGYSVHDLLRTAELAGYSVPTVRTLTKRLSDRQYRVGDVRYDKVTGKWYGVRKERED
jgi:hypothetical protein